MVFDPVNDEFIAADQSASIQQISTSNKGKEPAFEKLSTKFYYYKSNKGGLDEVNNKELMISSSEVQRQEETEASGAGEQKSKNHPVGQHLSYFADTWSILRFIKGSKSQGI